MILEKQSCIDDYRNEKLSISDEKCKACEFYCSCRLILKIHNEDIHKEYIDSLNKKIRILEIMKDIMEENSEENS